MVFLTKPRRLLLRAAVLACVCLAFAPQAGPVRRQVLAAQSLPTIPSCAWTRAAIGRTRSGNTGLIDTGALYLTMSLDPNPGTTLRLHGLFPYARYMSVTVYAGKSAVETYHIVDQAIVADAGQTNPFLPHANRAAPRRSYTLYIGQGLAPAHPAPNTLYVGPGHPWLIMYRVYAPDVATNDYGNVPAPSVDVLLGPSDHPSRVISLPTCSPVLPVVGTGSLLWLTSPPQWGRMFASGGAGVNADSAYLDVRLIRDAADVYMVRFKAPTFPRTEDGGPITGRENVRYWSMCLYDAGTGKVLDCVHDYEAALDRDGFVNIVLSTLENRPFTATRANAINWLPLGRGWSQVLIYRQILPNLSFKGNLQTVATGDTLSVMQRALGPYLPVTETCSRDAFTPSSCTDLVNPLTCSDRTEPVPCGTADMRRDPQLASGANRGERHTA